MLTRRDILQQAGRTAAVLATTAPWWLVRRAHAARQTEAGAPVRDPYGASRPLLRVGHPVLEGRGRPRREEIGGKPAQIEMAVGGDHFVFHGRERNSSELTRQVAGPRVRYAYE